MALETAQDLAGFFDTDAHGETATITINGSGSSISVIFNNEYFGIAPDIGVEIESTSPVVTGRSSDMTNVENGDTITISGVTYNIVNVQPDGQGITQLILETQ